MRRREAQRKEIAEMTYLIRTLDREGVRGDFTSPRPPDEASPPAGV